MPPGAEQPGLSSWQRAHRLNLTSRNQQSFGKPTSFQARSSNLKTACLGSLDLPDTDFWCVHLWLVSFYFLWGRSGWQQGWDRTAVRWVCWGLAAVMVVKDGLVGQTLCFWSTSWEWMHSEHPEWRQQHSQTWCPSCSMPFRWQLVPSPALPIIALLYLEFPLSSLLLFLLKHSYLRVMRNKSRITMRSKQSQNPARSGRSFTPPVLHKEQGCDQAQSRKSLLNNLKVKSTSKVTQQVSDTAGGSTQLSVKENYLIWAHKKVNCIQDQLYPRY